MATTVQLTRREEAFVRKVARAPRTSIIVTGGNSPPTVRGEEGYSRFKGGGVCNHPPSAIKAGYRVEYVPSTRRIEVGVGWLAYLDDPKLRDILQRRYGVTL